MKKQLKRSMIIQKTKKSDLVTITDEIVTKSRHCLYEKCEFSEQSQNDLLFLITLDWLNLTITFQFVSVARFRYNRNYRFASCRACTSFRRYSSSWCSPMEVIPTLEEAVDWSKHLRFSATRKFYSKLTKGCSRAIHHSTNKIKSCWLKHAYNLTATLALV